MIHTETIQNILEVFETFRMPASAIDQYHQGGKTKLETKLLPFVKQGKTIDFVMLGYPMKSTNHRDKTLGILPDYAEEVSFHNFTQFNNRLREVYEPGMNLSLVSDGFVFNDLLGEPDKVVDSYAEVSRDMARNAPVTWYSLRDFYNRSFSMTNMRESLMNQFNITPEELQRRIMMDPDVNALYRGMIHFMEEEIANRDYPSRNQRSIAAKKLTREMMLRNEAYSALVRNEFSSHIRLSMHQSQNNGAKYSVQLIPGAKAHHSPWHSALLLDVDGNAATIHRKDAEAAGFDLVCQDGRPYYFVHNTLVY